MALTTQQLATLKAAIIASPTAGPMRTAGDTFSLLAWCNGASPSAAWRTNVTGGEVYDAHKPVEYIARSAAERDAFNLMAGMTRIHDFTVAAKRNGVIDIFSGNTNQTSRQAILTVALAFATNAEAAIGGTQATATGGNSNGTDISALKRNWTGLVSQEEANVLVN